MTPIDDHARRSTRRLPMPQMEGAIARWYTKARGSANQLATCRRQATELTADLPEGARVLEVAPGPGYLAVEMARSGRLQVTALDISRTFVEIATDNARKAGVSVDVRLGNVEHMPFEDASFDLVVCQAAFKNFAEPVRALDEMHRVLSAGGRAVIQDMSRLATGADIAREVAGMGLGRLDSLFTRMTLTMLRLRAARPARFEQLAAQSAFRTCEIAVDGIGMEVRLTRNR